MTSPYLPLEVVETNSRREGRRFWVRDDESSWLFVLVEYVGNPGRLTCYCPDGEAHAETPGTEPECAHLRAAVEHMAPATARPSAPINVGSWVD